MECRECNTYTTNPSFCSRKCSVTYTNRTHPKQQRQAKRAVCRCGIELPKSSSSWCSWECKRKYQLDDWLTDKIEESPWGLLPPVVRDFLIAEANGQCTRCGWNEKHPLTDKCPLEVDHIDGNPRNNKRNNLKVLCPNCHSLTPTFRRKNAGKGRKRKAS